MRTHFLWSLAAVLAGYTTTVLGQPWVTNTTTSLYAVVPDPQSVSFAADGTLYAGRDNSGSGGGYSDAVKIHRIAPGGTPVTEFGNVAVRDPDVVIVDLAGTVSGTSGSVLVGGDAPGKISKVAPDGTVTTLIGPSSDYANPTGFTFDLAGRFLFTTYDNGRIYAATNSTPTLLFSLTHACSVAVDVANRIVINSSDETRLRLYTSSGALSNANFATVKAGTPIARAPGGAWGTDIYAVGTSGQLLRVDLTGTVTVLGAGFSNVSDIQFGPDNALYASDFANDRVYRFAAPSVPGTQVTIYAQVTDPEKLAFAPDGTLFVGRDNSGSGGGNADAVKIHRIAPGGSPVTEFGNAALPDPDAVAFDTVGTVSGTPASVVVGGVHSGSSGYLSRIAPDQNVATFFGPSTTVANPSDMVFDSTGRLFFTDFEQQKVFSVTNSTPVALCSLNQPLGITLDILGRIVVSSGADSILRLYSSDGALIQSNLAFAEINSPLVCGPGGFWGTDVYFVGTNGNLLCVSTNGAIRTMGSGFGGLQDLAFGPDGALYASQFANDSVWRILPTSFSPTLFIQKEGPNVRLSWIGAADTRHQLQSATDLPAVSWLDEGAPFLGTGGLLETNFSADGQRFFRIRVIQE